MKNYRAYEHLLKEVAEDNNLVMAEYLLNGLSLMDQSHEEDARRVYRQILKNDKLHRMANVFAEKLGVDQETAVSYFEKILFDTTLSRSEIGRFLPKLDDAYAAVFVSALSMGDIEVANLVKSNYPSGFPLKPESYDTINGHRIFGYSEHMNNLKSIEETKAVFELIVNSGLGDLVGKGDQENSRCWKWMVSSQKWSVPIQITDTERLSIPLPKLSKGVVSDPELLIAFAEGSRRTNYPEIYKNSLVWVADSDQEVLDESIIKILPVRSFTAGVTGSNMDTFDLNDFSPELVGNLSYSRYGDDLKGIAAIQRINVGIQASTGSKLDNAQLQILSRRLMPDDHLAGFNHPPGYTLCMVDTQWLEIFDVGGIDKVAFEKAQDFVSRFFSVAMIENHAEMAGKESDYTPKPQGVVYISPYSAKQIFLLLGDGRTREGIKNTIHPLLWSELFKRSGTGLGGRALTLAKEHLGLDLAKDKCYARMTWKVIEELCKESYSLWLDEAKTRRMEVSIDHQTSDHGRSSADDYQNLISIGGWPEGVPEYESIGQAITKGVRLNDVTIPQAYLRAMGVENVIPHIKTKAQWGFFFRTFENADIAPHLDMMPEHYRADLLADDLGL